MKVGFDGVLLGAWAQVEKSRRILDIGTGTGLVALMLAQRTELLDGVSITAIDIDDRAIEEARFNFAESPWTSRLKTQHVSLQNLVAGGCIEPFDLIVCNPPWHSGPPPQSNATRRLARHSDSLPLDDLFRSVSSLMTRHGRFVVVIPAAQGSRAETIAVGYGLHVSRTLWVRPLPDRPVHRALLEFVPSGRGRWQDASTTEDLTIELEHHAYTPEFRELARPFYLRF